MKITQKGHGRLLTLANLISMCALTGIGRPLGLLAFSGLFSTAAYILTDKSIAHFALLLLKANRVGVDMGKANKPLLPESLGIAAGTIYLIIMFLYLPIPFLSPPSSRLLFSSYFSSKF